MTLKLEWADMQLQCVISKQVVSLRLFTCR